MSATLSKTAEVDWDIDDNFLAHFKEIGLEGDENYEEGDEFITRI